MPTCDALLAFLVHLTHATQSHEGVVSGSSWEKRGWSCTPAMEILMAFMWDIDGIHVARQVCQAQENSAICYTTGLALLRGQAQHEWLAQIHSRLSGHKNTVNGRKVNTHAVGGSRSTTCRYQPGNWV
jgi:hypothetical protein